MFRTMTSWLRPSASRRRTRTPATPHFEFLEDRTVPDATPHLLSAGLYNQQWGAPASYDTNYNNSSLQSVIGFDGAGLGAPTAGVAGSIIGPGPGAVDLDLNSAQVLPAALGGTGIALFQSATAPISNNTTLGFKPAAGVSPFLQFHLDTTNVADVFVQYVLRDIDTSINATQSVALQFRIGNSGNFTTVVNTPDGTNGGTLTVNGRLPSGASGQALVQVRIITTMPTATAAEWIGVDDITIIGNRAPVVAPSGGVTTITENTGVGTTAVGTVDPTINITDADQSAMFDIVTATSGSLTVTILNPQTGDALDINNQGVLANQIGVVGNNVTFGGTLIGTAAGRNSTNLVITLNAAASVDNGNTPPAALTAIRALARQIIFLSTNDTPILSLPQITRNVQFAADDGRGSIGTAVKQVNVNDRNDIPTLVVPGSATTAEDVPVALNGITVADVDALGQNVELTVAVGRANTGTLTYNPRGAETVSGNGTATIVITGTLAQINASLATTSRLVFVPNLNYTTDTESPVPVNFTLSDLGNTSFSNPSIQMATGVLQLTVTGVNDPPVLDPDPFLIGNIFYPLNTAAVFVAPNANLSEPDAPKVPDLNGGILTVQAISGQSPDNAVRISSQGFSTPGGVGLQGQNVTYTPDLGGGVAGTPVIVGQITSSGTGTIPFQVTFNSVAATPAVVQAVIRRITFATTGTSFDTTTRVLRFNLTDGKGVSQSIAAQNINYTPPTVLYSAFDTTRTIVPVQINNAPSFTLSTTPPPAVAEDSPTQTIPGYASNISPGPAAYESGQVLDFLVSANTNPGLFAVAPDIDPVTGNLTYTLAADAFGTATVTLVLKDDGGTAGGGTDTSAGQMITFTVTPVADTPTVTPASPTTPEDIQVTVTLGRAAVDSTEVTHVKITAIQGGTLFQTDGTTVISSGEFVTIAQATAGLKFTPTGDANDSTNPGGFGFTAQSSIGGTDGGLGGTPAVVAISVTPVNDDPVLTGVDGTTTSYLSGLFPVVILGGAAVSDIDSPDFDTGVLTISGGAAGDLLEVQTAGTVSVSGVTVSVGGTPVGTVAGGAGTTPLTVTFNAAATPAAVQDVLKAVVFSSSNPAADRVLTVSLTDGDGGAVTPAPTTTVHITDEVQVVSITKLDPDPRLGTNTVRWQLTTDLPISGIAPANFTLVGTVAAEWVLDVTVTPGSGLSTTFILSASLNQNDLDGTLGLDFTSEAGLSSGVSNTNPTTPFIGQVYTIDRTSPTVTASADSDADDRVKLGTAVTYTITFSEDIDASTVSAANFVNAGTAAVSIGAITETSPGVFTVVVTPTGPAGTSTLQLRVLAAGTILDAFGNPFVGPYTDPTTIVVDAVAPTVTSITNDTNSTPANVTAPGAAVTYTVTFSEDIDAATVTAADFVNVAATNPVAITVGTITETSPGVFTVVVTPTTPTGGKLQLGVGPTLTDAAGNPMTVAFTDATIITSNVAPTANPNGYGVLEDGVLTVAVGTGVRANDTDPNDAVATLTVDTMPVTAPTKGTLVLAADGSFTYTPFLDANGADSFQYRVRDPFGGSAVGTVSITITPVNDAPTFLVTTPTVTVFEDAGPFPATAVVGTITSGGTAPFAESDALIGFTVSVTSASPTLSFSAPPAITLSGGSGLLTFTTAPDAYGTATVSVTLRDVGGTLNGGLDTSLVKTFTIVVNPVNDAPTFALTGNPPVSGEDGGLQTVAGFATFNPGPNEGTTGQTATYTLTVTSTTGGLTFVSPPAISPTGQLTYQAAPDSNGTAAVSVTVRDSGGTANGGANQALFSQPFVLVVRNQNDLPVANPDAALVPQDAGPTFINVLANDTPDPDGNEFLTVVSVGTPTSGGTVTVAPGGTGVRYTPAPGFSGTDTFTYTINDGNNGPATSTVTVTVRKVPAGQVLFDIVAVGTGSGGAPAVRVNSLSTGDFTSTFFAYDSRFRGGVNVAVGDVNGDGVPDVVVTPGPGGGPHVKVLDGSKLGLLNDDGMISDRAVLASFFAYKPDFTGGVTVTVADVNGDGRADIITGTGPGGGAHVKVLSGALIGTRPLTNGEVNPSVQLASFLAFDSKFRGGVNVAAGDVNGDGQADIITAAAAGGGSHVKVFDGLGGLQLVRSFFAYDPKFTGGVSVAAGDVNGDGLADIITGAGLGGGPHVKVFDSSGKELASFLGLSKGAGADVAYRVTATGTPLVVVGGQSGGSQVRAYAAPDYRLFTEFDAYEPTFLGGVEVG